jgi:hypothetical protein
MTDNKPVATVSQLVAKVTQSTANIEAHRQAMADVAAQVAAKTGTTPKAGGETK